MLESPDTNHKGNKRLMKRLLIFLSLKWDETVMRAWRISKVNTITYIVSFITVVLLFRLSDPPASIILTMIAAPIFAFVPVMVILMLQDVGPIFIDWIKDNWEEAGKRAKKNETK